MQGLFLFDLPRLATHGTRLVGLLIAIDPFHDTVHVEAVRALTPNERTVVARVFTVRAAGIEGHSTDATVVVVGDPFPNGNACVTKETGQVRSGHNQITASAEFLLFNGHFHVRSALGEI